MKRVFLLPFLAILAAHPAPAQEESPPAPSDRPPAAEDGREMVLDGLDLVMRGVQRMLGDIPRYAPPEIAENGDIIIRRLAPGRPEAMPEPDSSPVEPQSAPGGEIPL